MAEKFNINIYMLYWSMNIDRELKEGNYEWHK
jgi:hypothetical protein